MVDLLGPDALGVYALLTLVATIIGSIVLIRLARPQKRLSYTAASVSPVRVRAQVRGRVRVLFLGREVHDPRFVVLRISASGDTPIRAEDFERPMVVQFPPSATILEARVSSVEPCGLEPAIEIVDQAVEIQPLLLNPGDAFEVAALATELSELPTVSARIAGVAEVRVHPAPVPAEGVVALLDHPLLGRLLRRVFETICAFALIGILAISLATSKLEAVLARPYDIVALRDGRRLCADWVRADGQWFKITLASGSTSRVSRGRVLAVTPNACAK